MKKAKRRVQRLKGELLRRRIDLARARALVDVGDRMERRSRKLFDLRDSAAASDRERWLELNGEAFAFSKYGARLRREGVKLGKKYDVTLELLRASRR